MFSFDVGDCGVGGFLGVPFKLFVLDDNEWFFESVFMFVCLFFCSAGVKELGDRPMAPLFFPFLRSASD